MILLRTSTGTRAVASISVRTPSGLRPATLALRTANGTQVVTGGVTSLSVSPSEASGTASSRSATRVYTSSVTVGGFSGSPTITWTVPAGWSVSSPGNNTTSFRSPAVNPQDSLDASGSVTVNGQTATFDLYVMNEGGS